MRYTSRHYAGESHVKCIPCTLGTNYIAVLYTETHTHKHTHRQKCARVRKLFHSVGMGTMAEIRTFNTYNNNNSKTINNNNRCGKRFHIANTTPHSHTSYTLSLDSVCRIMWIYGTYMMQFGKTTF